MLQALLQTISNLGLDSEVINAAFNRVLDTIRGGNLTSLDGVSDMASGVISILTGISSADVSTVISALVSSVINILSNDGASTVLSTISGI